jgi:hypothetical protein
VVHRRSEAEKHPGVKAVYVIENVLGNAVLRDPSLEQAKYPVRLRRPAHRRAGRNHLYAAE